MLPKTAPISKGADRRLLSRLPVFSPVAVRLLSVLADENASFKDAARFDAIAIEVNRIECSLA